MLKCEFKIQEEGKPAQTTKSFFFTPIAPSPDVPHPASAHLILLAKLQTFTWMPVEADSVGSNPVLQLDKAVLHADSVP